MTAAGHILGNEQPAPFIWLVSSLILLPALLAAAALEQSMSHLSLPDEDAYRSPLSENLLESNRWRIPKQEEKRDWRLPAPAPPVGWRTPESSLSETSASKRTLDLFPEYRSGNPTNYDMIEREEKPLIKMFEFDSK